MSASDADGPAGMAGILFTETVAIPAVEATRQRLDVLALAVHRQYA